MPEVQSRGWYIDHASIILSIIGTFFGEKMLAYNGQLHENNIGRMCHDVCII